jgi:hypothetical protein
VLEAIGLETADAAKSLSAEDLETRMNEGTVIVSIRRESEPPSTPVGERPAEPVAEQSPP